MENSKFVDKFVVFAGKLGNQIHLKTLRDAFGIIAINETAEIIAAAKGFS